MTTADVESAVNTVRETLRAQGLRGHVAVTADDDLFYERLLLYEARCADIGVRVIRVFRRLDDGTLVRDRVQRPAFLLTSRRCSAVRDSRFSSTRRISRCLELGLAFAGYRVVPGRHDHPPAVRIGDQVQAADVAAILRARTRRVLMIRVPDDVPTSRASPRHRPQQVQSS